jgi:hypothetical protein
MLFSRGEYITQSDILSLKDIYIPVCYVLERLCRVISIKGEPGKTLATVSILGIAVHVGYNRPGHSSPFLDRSLS